MTTFYFKCVLIHFKFSVPSDGDAEKIELLIKAGADVNYAGAGSTAFNHAVENGNLYNNLFCRPR